MTLDEYKTFMSEKYFSGCKGKKVLEIGPHCGIHTKLIVENSPTYLELIEPYEGTAEICKKLPGVSKVIQDDVFFVLKNVHPMDVVVCCGVLYHLHSPLYLLELIVNNCQPKQIILDCALDQKLVGFLVEEENIIGNRQIMPNWRGAGFNLVVPFEIIKLSMENMGYILVKNYQFDNNIELKSKINFWVGLWERIE